MLPRPSEQVSVKVLNNQTQLAIPDAHIVIQDPDTEDVLHRSVDTVFPPTHTLFPPFAAFGQRKVRSSWAPLRRSALSEKLPACAPCVEAPPHRLPRVVDGLPRVVDWLSRYRRVATLIDRLPWVVDGLLRVVDGLPLVVDGLPRVVDGLLRL